MLQKRPRYTATSTMVYLKFLYQTQYLYKYKDSTNSSKSICKICDLEEVCGRHLKQHPSPNNTPSLHPKYYLPFSQIFAPHFDAFVHSLSLPYMSLTWAKKKNQKHSTKVVMLVCHWLLCPDVEWCSLWQYIIASCLGLTLAHLWYVILRGMFKVNNCKSSWSSILMVAWWAPSVLRWWGWNWSWRSLLRLADEGTDATHGTLQVKWSSKNQNSTGIREGQGKKTEKYWTSAI